MERILFVLLVFAFSVVTQAAAPLDPEDDVNLELKEDEGLVLFGVDTDISLERLRITRGEGFIRTDELSDIEAGAPRYFLYRLEADDYDLVGFAPKGALAAPFVLSDEMSRFSVKAGEISYIGTLIIRFADTRRRANVYLHNRSTLAWDWLEKTFPQTSSGLSYAYSGPFADDFHDYWQALQQEDAP